MRIKFSVRMSNMYIKDKVAYEYFKSFHDEGDWNKEQVSLVQDIYNLTPFGKKELKTRKTL